MRRVTAQRWISPLRDPDLTSPWWGLAAGLILGTLLGLALLAGLLHSWRLRAMDMLYRPRVTHAPVAIVAIDDDTLHAYGRLGLWPRSIYAELLTRLRAQGARVIVMDILFAEPAPDDAELARALDEQTILATAGLGVPRFSEGVISFPYLLRPTFTHTCTGHVNIFPDRDGVLRKLPLWIESDGEVYPAMAWQSAALYLGVDPLPPQQHTFHWAGRTIPIDANGQVILRYLGPAGSIPIYSMLDVMRGQLPTGALSGRIVFIGSTAAGLPDAYAVPIGGWMSGVEVQAQMTAALLADQTLAPLSLSLTFFLILFLNAFVGWAIVQMRPLHSAMLVLGLTVLILGAALYLFSRGYLLDYLSLLFSLVVSYVGGTLWTLEQERRKRASITSLFEGRASPQVVAYLQEQAQRHALTSAETRFVVALFADVRGYTSFTEREDPRKVQSVISAYLAAFAEAVIDADGVVTKYVGDRVVALFNAPYHVEQPVERAMEAALDGLRRLDRLWQLPEMPHLSMGIGINAGMAIVGLIGSPRRYDYDALGDVVNIASRLCDLAPAGEIYVTESIVAFLDESWEVEKLGSLTLKGRRAPVVTYRVQTALLPADLR